MGKGNVFFLKQPFKYHLNSYKMGNLISFMKNVANGLRESGNYGTAHIYRSSLNAWLAFHGSDNLPFRRMQDFLLAIDAYSAACTDKPVEQIKSGFSELLKRYIEMNNDNVIGTYIQTAYQSSL